MDSVTGSENSTTGQAAKMLGISNLVGAGRAEKGTRVGLSDITNKQMFRLSNNQLSDSQVDAPNASKEMSMLCKMLEERNKIIEVKSFELRTLRVSTQKLYTQNWQLAKTNAILLKELNSAKDKLKNQEHEHGCLLASLKAKLSELEARATKSDDAPAKMDDGPSHSAEMNNRKRRSVLKRRCESKSLSSLDDNTAVKEMPGSKQTKTRRPRKSRNLISDQIKLAEVDELEDEVTVLPPKSSEGDDTSVPVNSASIAKEHKEGIGYLVNCSTSKHPTELSTKSSGNAVPSKEKPVQTKRRMLSTHSSLPDLKKPKKEVEEVKRCFSSETAPYQPEEEDNKAEVGRRRSYRTATQKVVSYKEKSITMKERRMV